MSKKESKKTKKNNELWRTIEIPVEKSFAVYYCTRDGKSIVRFSDFDVQTEFVKATNVYGISPNFEEITLAAKSIFGNSYDKNESTEEYIDSDGYEIESGLNNTVESTEPQREYSPREMREMVEMCRRMRRKLRG